MKDVANKIIEWENKGKSYRLVINTRYIHSEPTEFGNLRLDKFIFIKLQRKGGIIDFLLNGTFWVDIRTERHSNHELKKKGIILEKASFVREEAIRVYGMPVDIG